ncbi:uridine kinase family protein [Actinokineospora inagensis]|uniref:uridine kinase family protein n=1 Tax=Actinokineospora inagensis TaxID=103730 RepID=UPI003CCB89B0
MNSVVDGVVRLVEAAPARLGRVRLVAVEGPSGSGKSTFARRLVGRLPGAALVPTDDFATWDDPVGWWPRLVDGVLKPLSVGRAGRYRRIRWVNGVPEPGDWIDVEPVGILLVEGVSAGRRAVASRLSVLVWCDLPDPAERLRRTVARDGAESRVELRRWQDFEAGWYGVDRTVTRASVRVTV